MKQQYTIGLDFGTLSGRAVLADAATGRQLADAVLEYPHGVMDTVLAKNGRLLPASFALQDPADYLLVAETVLPEAIRKAGVKKEEVVGICVDFTCCTVLPVDDLGTPLCFLPEYAGNPHAYVKLWKHHAAQPYADRLTLVAKERHEKFLSTCGDAVSCEWLFPKIFETLDKSPEVYHAAASFMEAGDWMNLMLTGEYTRGYLYAAYKAQYDRETGYPSEDFFAAVDPRMTHVVRDKLRGRVVGAGVCAGRVSEAAAKRFGLAPGTAVAAAMPDGHVAAASLDIRKNGDLFAVFGTSGCFYLVDKEKRDVPGICGIVPDGVVPGFYGYEAGLSCFGDHFAFAASRLISPEYAKEAEQRNISVLRLLVEKAAARKPGESGILALNWWNGNRSILTDYDLSGLFVGMTLQTEPEDLFRALLEANAFGTRNILDHMEAHGCQIGRMVASGGIARKDPFTMQLFSDVLHREIRIAGSAQAPALGSAVNAAAAAGVYPTLERAVAAMSSLSDIVYRPNEENGAVYDRLYAEYRKLHDYFGRGGNNVMKTLRQIAAAQKGL